jgi:hypothetical protein
VKAFNLIQDRSFLMKRVGDISQIAGLKRYELADGKAKGVAAVDVKTGSGFDFTVLPGRGMDVAWAEYKGVPVSYLSKTGIVSPEYFESTGLNWLRSFFAGMLTTCGLSNVGWPCEDDVPPFGAQPFGLHGRISNCGADNVCVQQEWQGDDLVMTVSGRMREAMLHAENLTLSRTIVTSLGQKSFKLHDVIANEGFVARPLMLLYHINVGYPVLDQHSRLIVHSKEIQPSDAVSLQNQERYKQMGAPVCSAPENVYFHDLKTGPDGMTSVGLVNDELELGVYVRFNKQQLPRFTEWKMLAEAEYVVGLEPGNCSPVGRVEQKKRHALEMLQPGEQKQVELEIGILDGKETIAAFEEAVESFNS